MSPTCNPSSADQALYACAQVHNRLHRVYVVDSENRPIGVITLTVRLPAARSDVICLVVCASTCDRGNVIETANVLICAGRAAQAGGGLNNS